MQRTDIIGWGVDAELADRPGVPMESEPPKPLGNMSLGYPLQQTSGLPAAKSAQRPLTPIYSTAVPPRGISGVIRRMAYRIPDYKPRRWMLLMLADRIDVIEHNPVRATIAVASLLGLGFLGYRVIRRVAA